MMLIESIQVRNLLSFGPDSQPLVMRPLNILIGPNSAGKSNFLEVFSLLHAAPTRLSDPIKSSGGIDEWLWKREPKPTASIDVVIRPADDEPLLRHQISFTQHGQRFELVHESISQDIQQTGNGAAISYYEYRTGRASLLERTNGSSGAKEPERRSLSSDTLSNEQSILSQLRDPERYPELSTLAHLYDQIAFYRDWAFGPDSPARRDSAADLPTDALSPSGDNLALILNNIRPSVKERLLDALHVVYEDAHDIVTKVQAGRVQLFMDEGRFRIPAARLSDGTLHYLALLAILLHPEPPPLICMEEPEVGLHPDLIVHLAELLLDASEHTQLIVTTHSDILVDALTEYADSIIVSEKHDHQTVLRRLQRQGLQVWLKKYSLGTLWRNGELGGNRW
jgi:predicted ATPase